MISRKAVFPHRFTRVWVPVAIAVVLIFLSVHFTAVQGYCQNPELKGTVRISGAWALYPMMVKWAEEFKKIHPKTRIDISAGGAGKGMADAIAGLSDVGMVSREIKKEEIRQGAFPLAVVKDAVFPVMNAANPSAKSLAKKGVTRSQLLAIWITGKTPAWGELAATQAREKVRVYTRSDACGAAETWASYLGNRKQEDLQGIGVYGDPGLADAIKKDVTGVGYNNLNYAFDMKTGQPVAGLMILPIDVNENGKLDANEDVSTKQKAIHAVSSGVYPSPPARDLYIVTKQRFKGLSREFARWILTDGQKYVAEAGYIPLKPSQIKKGLSSLEK